MLKKLKSKIKSQQSEITKFMHAYTQKLYSVIPFTPHFISLWNRHWNNQQFSLIKCNRSMSMRSPKGGGRRKKRKGRVEGTKRGRRNEHIGHWITYNHRNHRYTYNILPDWFCLVVLRRSPHFRSPFFVFCLFSFFLSTKKPHVRIILFG